MLIGPHLVIHPDFEPVAEKSVVEEPVGQEEWDEDNHLVLLFLKLFIFVSGVSNKQPRTVRP